MDPVQLIFGSCWADNMKLTYNNLTRQTQNMPGVDTVVPGWPTTDTMEMVDTTPLVDKVDYGEYFYTIVKALVDRGFTRGKNIYGAPYDFRKGPNESKEWFSSLKPVVEMAYEQNSGTRVVFIVHSMGGKMLLQFLQQQTTEWKDKYVDKMITLSVPWGGAVQSLQAISVGYDFGSGILRNLKMKEVQETCPSVVWLGPSEHFWEADEVLARTAKKNYTVSNLDEFYRDINNPNAAEMLKDLAPFSNFTAPGVEIHCLYGNNSGDTVDTLDFGFGFNPAPTLIKGRGDGTVNIRSLVGCERWRDTPAQNGKQIYSQQFPGVEHYNLLMDSSVVNHILSQLVDGPSYPYYEHEFATKKKAFSKLRFF